MDPIKGNSLNRSCGDVISSNCVTVPISIAGVCGPNPSLTQVLTAISNNSGKCCEGDFPPGHVSAYTGQWIDFNSTIPTSGTTTGSGGGSATWAITGFGSAGSNVPQYMWTATGDIKLRGNFYFTYTPTLSRMSFNILIHTFSPSNFPTAATAAQRIQAVTVDPANTNPQVLTMMTFVGLTISPSNGFLDLNIGTFNPGTTPTTLLIEFGGITFNLA